MAIDPAHDNIYYAGGTVVIADDPSVGAPVMFLKVDNPPDEDVNRALEACQMRIVGQTREGNYLLEVKR